MHSELTGEFLNQTLAIGLTRVGPLALTSGAGLRHHSQATDGQPRPHIADREHR